MATFWAVAETAQLIRKALKEAFPGQKFLVRSNNYADGASIDVVWTDGPTQPDVENVAKTFTGATFDATTGNKSVRIHKFLGEQVHFGVDFIVCCRELSETYKAICSQAFDQLSGVERCELFNRQRYVNHARSSNRPADIVARNIGTAPRPSPTAASVELFKSY